MGVIEIIAAILLILACVFIIVIVLMQDTKQGMSQTITGASADNYYQKNSGRTNEAKMNRGTKIAAITFFVIALLVNVVAIYFKGDYSTTTNSGAVTTAVTTEAAAEDAADEEEVTDDTATTVEETTAADTTVAPETSAE